MNYTTTEKELLAVVFACDKFRSYLVGSPVVVFSDHAALKYLLSKKDSKAENHLEKNLREREKREREKRERVVLLELHLLRPPLDCSHF